MVEEEEVHNDETSVKEEESDTTLLPARKLRTPSSIPAPYVFTPWVPPFSASRRMDSGSYIVTHDPAVQGSAGGKEIIKRYDGIGKDGFIEPKDPRAGYSKDAKSKVKGMMKQRTGLYELQYEVSVCRNMADGIVG
jgi:hypothetical protein